MRRGRWFAASTAACIAAASASLTLAAGAEARVALGFVAGPHASTESLKRIASTHATHVREKFSWAETEPQRGVFNWSGMDADMTAASAARISLLAVLIDTPDWAIATGTSRGRQATYPSRIADFTAWAGRVARRYGPNGEFWKQHPELTPRPLRSWQVWNEPNISSEWTGGAPSPSRYAALLTQTRDAVRAFDPAASFQAAGVAASGSAGSTPPASFLRAVWRELGAARSALYKWDIHAYSDTPQHAAALVPYMRGVMDSNGCRGCQITVGEFGWGSGSRVAQRFGWLCAGTQQNQASFANEFLRSTFRGATRARLVEMSWYRWEDPPPNSGATGCFRSLGVIDSNGRAKPSLAIFERFAS